MSDRIECPLCKSGSAVWSPNPKYSDVGVVSGCACPQYAIVREDIGRLEEWTKPQTQRLCTLLCERDYQRLSKAFLQFPRPKSYPDIDDYVAVLAGDLLRTWPHEIPRRIDRCLCNLVNDAKKKELVGRPLEIALKDEKDRILFSHDRVEKVYFIDAMIDYGWIGPAAASLNDQRQLMLTPKGYAHYDELTRGQAKSKSPVFVAMWFGGKSRTQEMSQLFTAQIEPAINNAGYKALRADSVEHNESIMDHVHDYIRQAPFVVAELTDKNQGVYYEAGFAKGLDKEVIYCCREQEKEHLHFDVTAIKIVLWDTQEDLCKRLEHRILGTVKRGPFTSEELAGTPS